MNTGKAISQKEWLEIAVGALKGAYKGKGRKKRIHAAVGADISKGISEADRTFISLDGKGSKIEINLKDMPPALDNESVFSTVEKNPAETICGINIIAEILHRGDHMILRLFDWCLLLLDGRLNEYVFDIGRRKHKEFGILNVFGMERRGLEEITSLKKIGWAEATAWMLKET
ncbi:MAG: hypothetical protein ABH845_05040 [Candidatus Omnitrophota bacterium]